jgi:hypothetical protein
MTFTQKSLHNAGFFVGRSSGVLGLLHQVTAKVDRDPTCGG